MKPQDTNECPSTDIAAYLDGELSPQTELELEAHVSNCEVCLRELNQQKTFVTALSSSLISDLEIPDDFTKRIVTNAESTVSGLRRRSEWLNAVFVCCGLFFFVLFSLGASAGGAFGSFFGIFERIAAVA